MASVTTYKEELNPSLKKRKEIKIAVFGFGRFQPPTKGHLDLINHIIEEANPEKIRKKLIDSMEIQNDEEIDMVCDPYLFSSISHNNTKDTKYMNDFDTMLEKKIFCSTRLNSNPIPYTDKFLTMIDYQTFNIWPKNITIVNSLNPTYADGTKNVNFKGKIVNVATIISFLYDRYDKIYFVIGSDRYIKGSFDEFFNRGLLEIIPTIRDENVISGTMARIQALQYFQVITPLEGDSLNKKLKTYGINFLGFSIDDMENILNPQPGIQQTPTNRKSIVEFIINQIFNYTIPDTRNIINIDIDWNSKEHCGKWDFKWTTPTSWDEYWRRGREHYQTRSKTRSNRSELEETEGIVDSKVSSATELRNTLRLKKNAPLYKSGVMPDYDPDKSEPWLKAYKEKKIRDKSNTEAYVKELRKIKYEIGRQINVAKDFNLKDVLINTSENISIDLKNDKVAVWTFGRFQPPHIEHDNLINTVVAIADYLPMKNVDAYVFTSQSSNKYNQDYEGNEMRKYIRTKQYTEMDGTYGSDKSAAQYHIESGKGDFLKHKFNENPLKVEHKLELLKKLHGKKYKNTINRKPFVVNVKKETIKTPYDALDHLNRLGYNKLFFVIGKDREKNFEPVIKYGKDKGIIIYLVAKDRLESQVSGTKVRNYALAGDFDRVKSSILQGADDTRLTDKDINVLIKNIQDNTFVDVELLKRVDNDKKRNERIKARTKKKKSTTGGGRRRKKTRKKRGGGSGVSRPQSEPEQQQQQELPQNPQEQSGGKRKTRRRRRQKKRTTKKYFR